MNWYVVRVEKDRPVQIWGSKWLDIEGWKDAKGWQQRHQGKEAANRVRKETKKSNIRCMSFDDIKPWIVGFALEDEPVQLTRPGVFVLPVIRATFPTLNAQQIVSVQPMTSPTAALFNVRYKKKP